MAINLHGLSTKWKHPFSRGFSTPGLNLRPVNDSDLPLVYGLLMDPSLYEFVADIDTPDEGIGWFTSVLGKRNYLFLAVYDRLTLALLGLIMINADTDKTLRLGGFLGKAHWAKGYATEIILGLQALNSPIPIYADIHQHHIRAHRLMKKTGCPPTGRCIGNSLEYRLDSQYTKK